MSIIFNHDELRTRILEKYGDNESFGKIMGMTKQRMNSRLKGETEFRLGEIEKASYILNLNPEEIDSMFFEVKAIR